MSTELRDEFYAAISLAGWAIGYVVVFLFAALIAIGVLTLLTYLIKTGAAYF